jgi:hypothetical protein
MVFACVAIGEMERWQIFKLTIVDARADTTAAAKQVMSVPRNARWDCIDMRGALNADVRTIFQQQYLTPRPATCSVRLGSDGYSPWVYYYWGTKPPAINLGKAPEMLDASGRLVTPQGVPFTWNGEARNIAFTSQWDKWPRSVSVPVHRSGDAVWFLVCGSTNQMQNRIPNAALRLRYSDGVTDTLNIVPPLNFWSLCPMSGGVDYDYSKDGFALPPTPPAVVQLGGDCRAILLNRRLRKGVALESATLQALSEEVVIGLMGVTVMTGE